MPIRKRFLSPSRSMSRPLLLLLVLISMPCLVLLGYYLHLVGIVPLPPAITELFSSPPQVQAPSMYPHSVDLPFASSMSRQHGSWPGIRQPPTRSVKEAGLEENAQVIGVCFEGKARAYAVAAMSGGPRTHVVNDLLAGHPVSVAYCNIMGCARVFTADSSGGPLDLGVGGWEGDKGLILLLDGIHYGLKDGKNLTSPGGSPLPYQRMDFQQTTWKEWRQAHPETDVYVAAPKTSGRSG